MQIKILAPYWGHEHLNYQVFLDKMKDAGYDGFDTWIPDDAVEKKLLFDYLQKHELHIVTHQHKAHGNNFEGFKRSFRNNLYAGAEPGPILINSHTGRDYFTLNQNLQLVDIALEFTAKTGIMVAHETHRGRVGYSPQMTAELFAARKDFVITADFSHWVCVTESMLENFSTIVDEAILRSRHIHTRVGFEEGPQVPHPNAPEWKYALEKFLSWWDKIIEVNASNGVDLMPMTTEFGPQPYMPAIPFNNTPVANQFAINCFMKDLVLERYRMYRV